MSLWQAGVFHNEVRPTDTDEGLVWEVLQLAKDPVTGVWEFWKDGVPNDGREVGYFSEVVAGEPLTVINTDPVNVRLPILIGADNQVTF
jgi:hypothetical protein